MPLARLYKDSHKLGYNTRDNPQDIPFEACQSMVNCFPGHPSPSPRFGIDKWNTNILAGAVKKQIPWADETAPKLILHIGDGLYWQAAGGGAITTIDASIVPANSKLSWVRAKDQLLINNNLTGANHRAWFLAWTGSTFSIRNANLVCPILDTFVMEATGTNIPANKVREYTVTLVNRDDAASMDGGGNPILCRLQDGNFHPGLLESIEDPDFRYPFTNGTSAHAGHITINPGIAVIDTQATHARVYVNVSADTVTEARGLAKRWLMDIPIKGANAYSNPWTVEDLATDGELAGSQDQLKTTGYEEIPPGTYIGFHQGRIWVGGVGTGEEIGRHFHSETPQDVEYPQKWWTLFQTPALFKDTSYEDGETAVGVAVGGNDLYFFMTASIWWLQDGDPDFEPRKLDGAKGTRFPLSITVKGKEILYLSSEGPAIIFGREVDTLAAHTAGEVWPKLHNNAKGYFFGIADKSIVEGFYFQETWWLTDGVKLIGHHMPAMGNAQGPLSIELADATIGFGKPCVLSEDLCLVMSGTVAGYIWNFLNKLVHADNGSNFTLKGKSKAMYVSQKDRDRCGEAYNLKVFAHYEDSAPLFLEFISDFFRYDMELTYNEHDSLTVLTSPGSHVSFRNLIEQPFPEGLAFSFCEIAWRKEHRTPYAFKHSGFIFEYLPKDGHVSEFISKDQGDGLVQAWPDYIFYAKFDENSDTLTDFSLNARHHTWANGTGGSRTHDASLVPGGGQSAVAGPGSGWSDADWDAMDYIGDGDGGLNSEDLTYEYVSSFPSLASAQVIMQGGDGADYWRILINTDGSLEFQLSTLSFKFTTAAGTIVAGATQYTIQFVLSNGGQNGQFYVAARTSAYASVTTTRSAL